MFLLWLSSGTVLIKLIMLFNDCNVVSFRYLSVFSSFGLVVATVRSLVATGLCSTCKAAQTGAVIA